MNWKKFKRFYGKSDGNWCSFIHLTVYIEQFRYCFHVQNNIKEKYDIILISNQIKRRWVKAKLIEWKLIGGIWAEWFFFVHYPIVFSAFLRQNERFIVSIDTSFTSNQRGTLLGTYPRVSARYVLGLVCILCVDRSWWTRICMYKKNALQSVAFNSRWI